MFEIDPFLEITLYGKGIDDTNADEFFRGDGRLDRLVEECDDLYMKIALRERAKPLRIPVIMETSDRGMLDVERFDLEPERPVYRGILGGIGAARLRGLTSKEKVPFILKMLDEQRMSAEFGASLVEVKESIHTLAGISTSSTAAAPSRSPRRTRSRARRRSVCWPSSARA